MLASRFLEVANLMRQPAALFDPQTAFRVWKGNGGAGPNDHDPPRKDDLVGSANVNSSQTAKQSMKSERAAKAEHRIRCAAIGGQADINST